MTEQVFKSTSSQLIENILITADKNYRELDNNAYLFQVNGYKIMLFALGDSMQLMIGFSGIRVTLNRINEWNKTKRFTRAYLDKDNDPVLEADLDFRGGVTIESIARFLGLFAASANAFSGHIA